MYFSLDQFLHAVRVPGKKSPLLAFFCLAPRTMSAAGHCQPIRGRYRADGPIRGHTRGSLTSGPSHGNTLECLDRDNQFLPQPVSLSPLLRLRRKYAAPVTQTKYVGEIFSNGKIDGYFVFADDDHLDRVPQ